MSLVFGLKKLSKFGFFLKMLTWNLIELALHADKT